MNAAKKFGHRYPWEKWFAMQRFELRRGVDYTCRTSSMAQAVYQASKREGFRKEVTVKTSEDETVLTVFVCGYRNGKGKRGRRAKAS